MHIRQRKAVFICSLSSNGDDKADVSRYGWDVVTYYSLPYRDRVNPAMAIRWGHRRVQ